MTTSEVIRIWELSGVERLHLTTDTSLIFKFAVKPFTTEADILINLAGHGIPVVAVQAWAIRGHTLGMLMEDLGVPVRTATEKDAATMAALLHATPVLGHLDTFDEEALTSLPERGLAALAALQCQGRFLKAWDISRALQRLAPCAKALAAGAERPPFGVCHGELHPTSLHLGTKGTRLLDLAKAFNGPGLLDLATWVRDPCSCPTRASEPTHPRLHPRWRPLRRGESSRRASCRPVGIGLALHLGRPLVPRPGRRRTPRPRDRRRAPASSAGRHRRRHALDVVVIHDLIDQRPYEPAGAA
ncbi:phosphotransferase [Micromonospora palomenae]|uniref:phosphotransferase n=1 Tax=Micromonospora palomenae TaxID=1461247 RepID=UPI003F897035